MFSAITPRYDVLNGLLSMGLDRGWRRHVVALARLQPGQRALDVCTGTGDLAALLAQAVGAGGRTVGLDFCPEMLEKAGAKFPSIEWVQGDALQLPFDDASFEAATMAFGLRNVENTQKAFTELKRVVAPGGRVLILELTRPHGPLRALYYPYLLGLLPLLGGLVSGNFAAYRYLGRSIAAFLPIDRLLAQMEEVGLRDPQAIPLLAGVATILMGEA